MRELFMLLLCAICMYGGIAVSLITGDENYFIILFPVSVFILVMAAPLRNKRKQKELEESMLEAAVVVMTNEKDEILLLERAPWCKMQGWCTPGGMIEKGEKPVEAALREVFEETSYMPLALKYHGRTFSSLGTICYVFSCKCKDPQIILSEEHVSMKWMSIDKARMFHHMAGKTLNFIEMVWSSEL